MNTMRVADKRTAEADDLGVLSPLRLEWSEKIFDMLTDVLNEVHGMHESKRFWMLIVEEHVRAMISRKEILDQGIVKKSPDLFPVVSNRFPGALEKFKKGLKQLAGNLNNRKNLDRIHRLLEDHNVFLIGFNGFPAITEDTGGVNLPDQDVFAFTMGDRKKRLIVNKISGRYEDPFLRNIIMQLPTILVEHFDELYSQIELYQPEKKVFHIQGKFNFAFRQLVIAKYIAHGARLIWYQNGGFIGEVVSKYSRYLTHEVSDEYRTWGWQLSEKDQPWGAYFLERFARKYNRYKSSDIDYDLLVCFPKFKGGGKSYYREKAEYLFQNLDRQKYRKILARPQPSNNRQSHASMLGFIRDERVTVSSALPGIAEEMAKSRCVIQMNVPATNFPECIYLDYPVIGLLNNDQPTPIIKPYYDFFLESGVLHDSIESLVSHLNRIEINEWWNRVTREEMYQSYKETFTRKVH
jgi:hypothetical protein